MTYKRLIKWIIISARFPSPRMEFGGLHVPSLELDVEHAHYASFTETLANMITDYESE
jgi:hypothetical protein